MALRKECRSPYWAWQPVGTCSQPTPVASTLNCIQTATGVTGTSKTFCMLLSPSFVATPDAAAADKGPAVQAVQTLAGTFPGASICSMII